MQRQTQRHAAAIAQAARVRAAYGNGLVGSGSWSFGACFTVPTTDHKAMSPRRPEVAPW